MPDERRAAASSKYDRAMDADLIALRLKKVSRALRHPLMRCALRHGVLASTEHDDVPFPFVPEVVYDVGAHRGQFAVFARARWPKAEIISFEPIAEEARRISCVAPGVSVKNVALGVERRRAQLHLSRASDSSSLFPIAQQAEVFPGTEEAGSLDVEVERLDTHMRAGRQPSLLKIDVQGGELDVLKGADLDQVDCVYVESSFVELYTGQALAAQVIGYLDEHRFRLADIRNLSRSPESDLAVQADLLFVRDLDVMSRDVVA
jgi:FkbM family methyltransferase